MKDLSDIAEVLAIRPPVGEGRRFVSACALCHDTTFIRVVRGEWQGVDRCVCWKNKIAAARKITRFGEEYKPEARIEDLAGPVRTAAEAFLNDWDKSPGLMLAGTVGTGKTYAASAIANELLKGKTRSMTFATVPFLMRDLRREELGGGTETPLYGAALSADLLVLDDLGAQKSSEWVEQVLYMLISERAQKPLIVTGNVDMSTLEQTIGRRTLDRLLGRCGARLLLEGHSRRWTRRTK